MLGFASKNEVSKSILPFSDLSLIKQLTINSHAHCPETLLMQEHTVQVDYHCFKCRHVLTSSLPKRKY